MLRVLGRFLQGRMRAAFRRFDAAGNAVPDVAGTSADVRVSLEGDGAVFLHIGEGRLFRTNATGRRIWQLLLDNRTVSAIAEQLSAEYGVPSARIEGDARAFVVDLRNAGLLTISNLVGTQW